MYIQIYVNKYVSLYVYICMYIYIYLYMYICIYIYVYMYIMGSFKMHFFIRCSILYFVDKVGVWTGDPALAREVSAPHYFVEKMITGIICIYYLDWRCIPLSKGLYPTYKSNIPIYNGFYMACKLGRTHADAHPDTLPSFVTKSGTVSPPHWQSQLSRAAAL